MTGELGVRIVTEIADREAVDPTALTPPLHDVIDPDALEALFEPTATTNRNESGSVSFSYRGYDITVTASGEVHIRNGQDSPSKAETAAKQ